MPKRVNNFFEKEIKFSKMLQAYERASKGKHYNKEVILFELDLANNLTNILKDIYAQRYKYGEYRQFKIYEPKERIIKALPFRDRVVHQWYVEEFIKKIFVPKFIKDSYACIEGKGVHKAVKQLQFYMIKMYHENKDFYILKCDIAKFFNNIDKQILYEIIKRYTKDKKYLKFTYDLIFFNNLEREIPIGNYTSQFFANIYLNELDHFVKEKLHIKYYVRYMDDFVLLVNNKEEAKDMKNKIEKYINTKLKLEFNKKTNYFPNKNGVKFCGFRVFTNKVLLKNDNKKKIYKRVKKWNKLYKDKKLDLKKAYQSLTSWKGHAKHSNSYKYQKKIEQKCLWLYNEKEGEKANEETERNNINSISSNNSSIINTSIS